MGAGGAMEALGNVKGGEKHLTIDKKTYWYIKKYLAHKIAFEKAIEKAMQGPSKLKLYAKGGGKSLKTIAGELKVDEGQLEDFNTWLLGNKIPQDKTYQVIIPSLDASIVLAAANPRKISTQATGSSSSLPPTREIVLGEDAYRQIKLNGLPGVIAYEEMTIDELADLLDFDPNKLISYNDLLPHNRIIVGQIYYLKAKRNKARIFYHTVQEGDTVWMVAQNYGVKQNNLMKMNRIIDSEINLEVGRVLWLRKTRPESTSVEYWPGANSGG